MNKMVVVGALAGVMLVGCTAAKDGLPGASGPAGAQGQKGDQGVPGPSGPQGIQGLLGAQGPAGAVGVQGAKGLIWRGTWSNLDSYFPDDAVEHNGTAFVAIALSSGAPPPGVDWQLLAGRGAEGAPGPQGPSGPQGLTGPAGADGLPVTVTAVPVGHFFCANGGTQVHSTTGDAFACNGASGPIGIQGTKGDTGLAGQSVATLSLPVGDTVCVYGGTQFTSANGVAYACNGAPSASGRDDPARVESGSLFTQSYAGAVEPCKPNEVSGTFNCIKLADGPLVITDLGAAFMNNSGFNGNRYFVGGSSALAPRWTMLVFAQTQGFPAIQTGLNLSIRQGESLWVYSSAIGLVAPNDWLTWSGFRP